MFYIVNKSFCNFFVRISLQLELKAKAGTISEGRFIINVVFSLVIKIFELLELLVFRHSLLYALMPVDQVQVYEMEMDN